MVLGLGQQQPVVGGRRPQSRQILPQRGRKARVLHQELVVSNEELAHREALQMAVPLVARDIVRGLVLEMARPGAAVGRCEEQEQPGDVS